MNKWNRYFMNVAKETSLLSRDTSTKVGAVITKDKRIKSAGFNGAPQSFPDELVPTPEDEADSKDGDLIHKKNTYMCHAELNAILNYDGKISDLRDSVLYTTVSPCSHCAKMIAQIGIKGVVYLEPYHRTEETTAAKYIFDMCGVSCKKYDENA